MNEFNPKPGWLLRDVRKADERVRYWNGETSMLPTKTVYLAGPISGLNYEEATNGWRARFKELLPPHIHCLSPMRCKEFLATNTAGLPHDPNSLSHNPLSTAKGITARDRNDVRTCDAMIGYFLGAEKASVGTCIEFGWADAFGKPVIMVIEPDGELYDYRNCVDGTVRKKNPHWHGMMSEIAGFVVPTLEEAAHILSTILTPGH